MWICEFEDELVYIENSGPARTIQVDIVLNFMDYKKCVLIMYVLCLVQLLYPTSQRFSKATLSNCLM